MNTAPLRATAMLALVGLTTALLSSAPQSPAPSLCFEDVADAAELHFTHMNGARGDFWYPELIGSGVALFDYDGDGDLDVYLVQGAEWQGSQITAGGAAAISPTSPTARLFRNDLDRPGGRLRFTDVTQTAGVATRAYGMGATVGDIDNDGDLDLYVTAYGDNVLYRNDGNGRFSDITMAANANDPRWSTSAAFLDYDRDGHIDLFIGNYVDFTPAGHKACFEPAGGRDYCAPTAYRSIPDRLLRNRGDGTFEDATAKAGIDRADGNALGVAVGDYDSDGWPDIYVANDATPNQLWINQRDGTFADMGVLSGTAYNAAGRPEGSMGIASGDYDHDGDEDLVVTNIVGETFAFYENDGTGGFEDRRVATRLASATAAMTGFGVDWFDADNDGWLDLFIANGAVNLIPALRGTADAYRQRNQLFVTEPAAADRAAARTPVRLREVTTDAGPGLELIEVSRGVAIGDLDLDGRVDVVVTNNGGPVRLLRNVTARTGHWLRLALRQPSGNRFALGALVRLERPGAPPLVRRVRSGGSYLSSSDLRLHIGLGTSEGPVDVTITWPDGIVETRRGLAPDREHVITRARAPR